jgi:single-stranded-DNA-specific exonuclease
MKRPRNWSFRTADPDLERALERELSLSPLAARVLALRGVTSCEHGRSFLEASLKQLTPPSELPDMDRAIERLLRALAEKQRILVFGDSDVDGLSGACLLARVLKAAGADVDVHVADRATDGYGLSEAGEAAVVRRKPAVLVTVDHGVTAFEAVGRLQSGGIDVIVTDHHQKPDELPPALAVVNPLRLDPGHPAARLSGAGVAFKLACGIFEALPSSSRQTTALRSALREGLALAALGTVADVVALIGENRLLVRHGLQQLAETGLAGLRALRSAANLDGRALEAEDVSFGLAPRLNAAGRLGQVDLARRLLLCDSPEESQRLAATLERLNQERRTLEAKVHARALERLKEVPSDAPIVCLGDPGFHSGVIGIVAAKLVARTGKPVMLVSTEGAVARGSGRSVPGFDLARALVLARDHLRSCGGHAAAAGLEMEPSRVGDLARALTEIAAAERREPPPDTLDIDSEAMLHQMTPRLCDELRRLGPFGEGNPQPLFAASNVELAAPPRRVGQDGAHLQLRLRNGPKSLAAIAFGHGHRAAEAAGSRLSVAFTPRPSTFAGGTIELLVADLKSETKAQAAT